MQKKNKNIRFIRKNGRVIPIRIKSEKSSPGKTYLKGMGVSLSGTALGLGLASDANRTAKKDAIDPIKFKKKYKKFYKQAGRPDIKFTTKRGAFAVFGSSKNLNRQAEGILGVSLNRRSIILGSLRDEAVALHEMGHLKASRKKYSFNKLLRAQNIKLEKHIRKGRIGRSAGRGFINNFTRPFINLGSEAEASAYATKAAFKKGGFKKGFKVGSKLALPYTTYALVGAGSALQLKALYDYARKPKKVKSGR